MGKVSKRTSNSEIDYIKEYRDLMNEGDTTFQDVHTQWNNRGDQIEKFTLYEDYTPVKTTGGTNYKPPKNE